MIASRADPDLGLARLRLEERLVEVRAAELAFTERRGGGDAAPGRPRPRPLARSSGWSRGPRAGRRACGWRRCRRVHAPDPERFLAELAGDDRAIGDYLTEEVLALQPAEVREFLLRTSVVDRVCGELANALTGGARRRAARSSTSSARAR